MKMPIRGSNPPFKNITETDENKRHRNTKNNPDKIKETVLLKIITSPVIEYIIHAY